ncbi:hypothetical protein BV25DRAFT_1722970 [Artomyces pyxidatus]|uniref:Uncharacterized protein n=1 Tax=Artomyces pyxidatus TaxID=48021 RepID=A0ACB8SIR9_9AGAM|nr:hypothetical protein BV25DRAFT_1722970 [Artomyces pyxidatus]
MSDVQGTVNPFPPGDWLGYGINLIALKSPGIDAVKHAAQTTSRIIKLDTESQTVSSHGTSYQVPNNVDLAEDVGSSRTTFETFANGTEAIQALSANGTLADIALPVSGLDSNLGWIQRSFSVGRQYALHGYSLTLFDAKFESFSEWVDVDVLKQQLLQLPSFDASKKDTISAYRACFASLGSHVIVGTTYGAQFLLTVSAPNKDKDYTQHFEPDVQAAYHGIPSDGNFDETITSTPQFKAFVRESQASVQCVGGNPTALLKAVLTPSTTASTMYQHYLKWLKSTDRLPSVVSFQLKPLYNVLFFATDTDVAAKADDIQQAFEWLFTHKPLHLTTCRFSVTSDSGQVALLTPGAFFVHDPTKPLPQGARIDDTKLFFVQPRSDGSLPHETITIDCTIKNDGSPIDVTLSHGVDGTQRGNGTCSVRIYETTYTNDSPTDGSQNGLSFQGCPVDPEEKYELV